MNELLSNLGVDIRYKNGNKLSIADWRKLYELLAITYLVNEDFDPIAEIRETKENLAKKLLIYDKVSLIEELSKLSFVVKSQKKV